MKNSEFVTKWVIDAVKEKYADGSRIDELCEEYHLSCDTIRKIIYTRKL